MHHSLAPLVFLLVPPLQPASQEELPNPVAAMQRLTLEVRHWEGSFGSYRSPGSGGALVLDLERVGTPGLIAFPGPDDLEGHLALEHLRVESDVTTGDARAGWTRRVLLKGRRPGQPEKTVLELLIQYEVAAFEQHEGRPRALRGNATHVDLRLHTLRDDDTIREYMRAGAYHDRDSGLRLPAPAGK